MESIELEPGSTYAEWTVVGPAERRRTRSYTKCRCSCGLVREVCTQNLRNGKSRSCGHTIYKDGTRTPLLPIEVGTKISRWTVVHREEGFPRGGARWLCRCECGRERIISALSLRNGASQSCGCLALEVRKKCKFTAQEANDRRIFNRYHNRAKHCGISFTLTLAQFQEIIKLDCYYCGAKPRAYHGTDQRDYSEPHIRNGLDRFDNSKGYSIDNVKPCCFRCNMAKSDWPVEEFLEWAARLSAHLPKLMVH